MISYELHTLIDNIEELIKKKDWEEIKNSILPHYKISGSIIMPRIGESSSGRTCGSGP